MQSSTKMVKNECMIQSMSNVIRFLSVTEYIHEIYSSKKTKLTVIKSWKLNVISGGDLYFILLRRVDIHIKTFIIFKFYFFRNVGYFIWLFKIYFIKFSHQVRESTQCVEESSDY